jgi:hypothetical protein
LIAKSVKILNKIFINIKFYLLKEAQNPTKTTKKNRIKIYLSLFIISVKETLSRLTAIVIK